MTHHEDLILLYTSTEINTNVLKEILEDNQIGCIIRNELKSGLSAGFGGGYPETEASLYVPQKNFEEANKILQGFLASFESEDN